MTIYISTQNLHAVVNMCVDKDTRNQTTSIYANNALTLHMHEYT